MNSPSVLTYRLNGKMVYVPPAKSYEQAVDFAQNEFADELCHVKRERISFSVLVNADKTQRSVRIGAMAWPAVVPNLKRYEIVEVHVQPELYVEHVDGPPRYQIAVGVVEESKEATEFFARSHPARTSAARSTKNQQIPRKGGYNPFIRLK